MQASFMSSVTAPKASIYTPAHIHEFALTTHIYSTHTYWCNIGQLTAQNCIDPTSVVAPVTGHENLTSLHFLCRSSWPVNTCSRISSASCIFSASGGRWLPTSPGATLASSSGRASGYSPRRRGKGLVVGSCAIMMRFMLVQYCRTGSGSRPASACIRAVNTLFCPCSGNTMSGILHCNNTAVQKQNWHTQL